MSDLSKNIARNDHGQWMKGQSGNPRGRLPANVEHEYLNVFFDVWTLKDWREVCDKALSQAKGGDRYARDWASRVILPILERVIVASMNLNVDMQLDENQVGELIGMLVGGNDMASVGDVIDGQATDVSDE